MANISLRLLGSFEAYHNSELITIRRQPRAIVAYLAARCQPCRRQALIDLFCREAQDPAGALRLHLSRIRSKLGSASLLTEDNNVQFNSAAWVDVLIFQQQLDRDLAGLRTEILQAALELYRGDLLDGLSLADAPEFELWLLSERARLRRLYQRGLDEIVTRLTTQGNYQAAIQWAQRHWQSDPLLEAPPARLMQLYALTGQRTAALDLFKHYETLLRQELAVEPPANLVALRDQIVANQFDPDWQATLPTQAFDADLRQAADFVGREAELSRLRLAWQAACGGHGGLVLVKAEAGGGKTRLVREFAAGLTGIQLLAGDCHESAQHLPYAPWIELLEARLEVVNSAALLDPPAFWLDYLLRLLPRWAEKLGRVLPPALPTDGGETERLFLAVAEFLLRPAESQAIFIDNLQWADEASLRLFHFIARRVQRAGSLLIGAFRVEEVENTPALQTLLDDLARESAHHLTLAPFSPAEVVQLTGQLWLELAEADRDQVCRRLTQATGGHPLFIVEMLRELAHTGSVPQTLPVPESVSQLVRHRLRRLPDSGRQVLEGIAILETPVTPDQAQQTSARSEAETIDAIDAGLKQSLLAPVTVTQPTRYDFIHDLIREAIIGQLSYIRRQLLHRRAAAVLERDHAAAATLAYHWQMAGSPDRERYYAGLAGKEAAAQFAHAEATMYLTRALELTADQDWAQQYELLLLRESIADVQGLRQAQADDLERLRHLVDLLADESRQMTVMLRQAYYYRNISDFDAAIAAARQVVQLAEARQDTVQQARGYLEWGISLWRYGDNESAEHYMIQARRLSIQAGLRNEEISCDLVLGGIRRAWGDYKQSIAAFERALDHSREIGHQRHEASALGSLGVIATDQGNYAVADTCYRQAMAIYHYMGDRWNQAITLGNHAGVFIDLGDYASAEKNLLEACQIFTEINDRRATSYQLTDLCLLAHYRSDNETALDYGQQALELATSVGEWPGQANAWLKVGHALAGLGQFAEAADAYQQALNIERQLEQLTPAMEALAGLARVALGQQDLAQAQAHIEQILDHLTTNTLEGAWEPFRVYLTCYQVLQAAQDARAQAVLTTAYDLLQARATRIDDESLRRSFLEKVSFHRDIIRAYEDGVTRK